MKNTFKKLMAGTAAIAVLSTGAVFAEEMLINEVPADTALEEAVEIVNAPIEPIQVEIAEHEGIKIVPVRAVAEHFGYTVEWNGEDSSVSLSKGAVFVKFAINENSYAFSRMMPQQLETAPILINDETTYVPASLFTEILNLNARDLEEGLMEFVQLRTVTVTAIDEENSTITVVDDFHGEVIVNITEDTVVTADGAAVEELALEEGQLIDIEYANFMTMSIPPQTNAVTIELLNTVTDAE